MFADMHMHSRVSDGTCTPEELARMAAEANVSVAALADHNTMDGTDRMRKACAEYGVTAIDAAEFDALYLNEDLHILAYGPDRRCRVFADVLRHERAALDGMSTLLVQRMLEDGQPVCMEDYLRYPDDKPEGGWKALYYLKDCGAVKNIRDVFPLYDKYDVNYSKADFLPADELIDVIHLAGGFAVLAHPGIVDKNGVQVPDDALLRQIRSLFALGLDGVECIYPKHTVEQNEAFLSLCRADGKLITSGADCHGTFSGDPVGCLRVPLEELDIGLILMRQQQI